MDTTINTGRKFGNDFERSTDMFSTPVDTGAAPSTGEVVSAYMKSETVVGSYLTYLSRRFDGEVDPDFDQWEYISTLPEEDQELAIEYNRAFSGPSSARHVDSVLSSIKAELADEQIKQRAGGVDTVLGIGASMFDASTFIPFFGVARKAGLVANVARGFAAGAGVAAVEEALIHQVQDTRDINGSLIGIGAAGALGGTIGGLAKVLRDPERYQKFMEEDITEVPVGPADLDSEPFGASTAGAARRGPEDGQEMNKSWTDHVSVFGLNHTASTVAAQTKNGLMRKFLQMGSVSWGRKNGDDVAEVTAEEFYGLREAAAHAAVDKYNRAFAEYNKAVSGRSISPAGMARGAARMMGYIKADERAFNHHVAEFLADKTYKTGDDVLDSHIAKAGGDIRKVQYSLFDEASKRGLFKTDKIREVENQIKKLTSEMDEIKAKGGDTTKIAERLAKRNARLDKLTKELGDFDNYFTQAFDKGEILVHGLKSDSKTSMVDILTREFSKTGYVDDAVLEFAARKSKSGMNVDELAELLEEGGIEALPEDIQKVLIEDQVEVAAYAARNVVNKLNDSRTLTDGELPDDLLEFSSRFKGRTLHLSREARKELRENGYLLEDPRDMLMMNMRDVGAKISVHEKFGTIDVLDPVKSPFGKEIEDEYARLIQEGKIDPARAKVEREVAQNLIDRLLNRNQMASRSGINWVGRNARRLTSTLLLGGAGISQLADLFVASLQMGVGGVVGGLMKRSLGDTGKIIKGLKNEELKVLLHGLDSAGGEMRVLNATDMSGSGGSLASRGFGASSTTREISGHIDRGMTGLTQLMQYLNLQHPMTILMRQVAFENFNRLLLKASRNPEKISDQDWTRLASLGLDKKTVARMGGQKTYQPSKGYDVFDIDEWEDIGLRNAFLTAAHRNASNSVVQVQKGMTPDFFDNELAKVIFQFQQFSYGMSEVVLRNFFKGGVLPKDARTASALMFGLSLAIVQDMIKEAVKGREVTSIEERFANPARTAGTIYNAVDRAGLLAMVSPYTQLGMRGLGAALDVDFFGTTGRFRDADFLGLAAGPSGSILEKAGRVYTGAVNGDSARASYNAIRLLPFNNHFAIDGSIRRAFGIN